MPNKRLPSLLGLLVLWVSLFGSALRAEGDLMPLRSGSELDYPPLALVSDVGAAEGFSVDMLTEAANRVGYDPQFSVMSWAKLREGIEQGEFDVLPLVAYSEERAEKMLFSRPYLILHGSVFVRSGEEMRVMSLENLKGKQVIVLQGDIAEDFLNLEELGEQRVRVNSLAEAMTMLAEGHGDCVLATTLMGTVVLNQLGLSEDITMSLTHIDQMETRWCFAAPKGSETLIGYLDEALVLMRADGTYDELYNKWLSPYDWEKVSIYQILLIRGLGLMLVLALILWLGTILWTNSLKRTVRVRTEQLRHARDDAEKASRAKSEFLAIMSHELRTPLNPIIAMSELLLEKETDTSKRDCLNMVHGAGKNLLGLINDILDLSRIETGKLQIKEEKVPMEGFIQSMRGTFMPSAREKKLALNIQTPYPIPEVLSFDPLRVRQVVYNLLTNAIRYTDRGSVTVHIRFREDTRVESEQKQGTLEWRVSDTGNGISEKDMEDIFDPFKQSDARSSLSGGLGLGLAVCKRLSTRMGGSLRAESEKGKGSRFTFEVPVKVDAEHQAVPDLQQELPLNKENKLRILIVEDDLMSRQSLRMLIAGLGYDSDTTAGGLSTLSLIERERYAIVFMDVRMPEITGIEMTERIRIEGKHQPYIIAQTAHAMRSDRERCLASGMNDYMSKPIAIAELKEAIRRAQEFLKAEGKKSAEG